MVGFLVAHPKTYPGLRTGVYCIPQPTLVCWGGHPVVLMYIPTEYVILLVYVYKYLYITEFEVVWLLNGSKYSKAKKQVYPNFGFSFFFVWSPNLQQVSYNMTVIIYIYLYLEKFEVVWECNGSKYGKTTKHIYHIFGFLSFCVKDPPLYLQQGGHKMTFIPYIYLYIEKFQVPWELNSSKYGKTKKHR